MALRYLPVVAAVLAAAACGGGAATTTGGATASGSAGSSAEPASNSSSVAPEGSGERRSGLSIHIQNVVAEGALPEEADSRFDRLNVSFELEMTHMGTEPLTGLAVTRARLVADDGREVVFGVTSQGWDGRLEAGAHRVVPFQKTPDSASPPPTRRFCRLPMRLEVTLDLAGRQARATSRRVEVRCP
jgi:hypothetical protein